MNETEKPTKHPWGKHRYKSVIEGCAMAAQFRQSGLTLGQFVQQTGVTRRMVEYWLRRERELATTATSGFAEVTAVTTAESPAEEQIPSAMVTPASPPPPEPVEAQLPATASTLPLVEQVSVPKPLEIRLPGGVIIPVGPGFDADLLRDVVACLGASC